MVREQVVRGRDAEQRETGGLAQQAAAPGPLAPAAERPRPAVAAVQLVAQFIACKQYNNNNKVN